MAVLYPHPALSKDPITSLFQGLGLEEEEKPQIDYRERAPLVIPPSGELRPPVTTKLDDNPNWPKDPDAARRNAERLDASRPIDERRGDPSKPLSRDELRRGAVAGLGRPTGTALRETSDSTRDVVDPDVLGSPKWGIFGSPKREAEVYTGEPQRQSLTEPPQGLRQASPNQPWAPPPKKGLFGNESFYDRTAR